MEPLRVLIVDDEPSARRGIRRLLEPHPDVAVVGEAGGVEETRKALAELAPDIVFLDVRMPGGSGLDALKDAEPEQKGRAASGVAEAGRPVVVLVTAYEDHALEAFDVEAVDYLLKPFSDADFDRALGRARRQVGRIRAEHFGERIRAAVEELTSTTEPAPSRAAPGSPPSRTARGAPERVKVRYGDRVRLIDPATISWVEAEGDYVRIHTPDAEHLVRATMSSMAETLGDDFIRAHRSTLVRGDFIREIRPRGRGRHALVLQDGRSRNVSRRGYERLQRVLGL